MSVELTETELKVIQYLRSLGMTRVELDIDEASQKLSINANELVEALISLMEKGLIKPEKLPPLPQFRQYVEQRLLQLEAEWVLRFARGVCAASGGQTNTELLPEPLQEMLQSGRWPEDLWEVTVHKGYLEEWKKVITLLDDSKLLRELPPLPCDPRPLLLCIIFMLYYLSRLGDLKGRVDDRAYNILLCEYNQKIVIVARLLNRFIGVIQFAGKKLGEELENELRTLEAIRLDESIRGISRKRELEELSQAISFKHSEISALESMLMLDKLIENTLIKLNELNKKLMSLKHYTNCYILDTRLKVIPHLRKS